MSYVHSGSVLFQKQRVLCAEHAQTKSAPKPLQNTLHGKPALSSGRLCTTVFAVHVSVSVRTTLSCGFHCSHIRHADDSALRFSLFTYQYPCGRLCAAVFAVHLSVSVRATHADDSALRFSLFTYQYSCGRRCAVVFAVHVSVSVRTTRLGRFRCSRVSMGYPC